LSLGRSPEGDPDAADRRSPQGLALSSPTETFSNLVLAPMKDARLASDCVAEEDARDAYRLTRHTSPKGNQIMQLTNSLALMFAVGAAACSSSSDSATDGGATSDSQVADSVQLDTSTPPDSAGDTVLPPADSACGETGSETGGCDSCLKNEC